MSTKPGVTMRHVASISVRPALAIVPIAAIRDPVTATSASTGSLPVPSTTRPPRMTKSKLPGITADRRNSGTRSRVVVLVPLLRQLALVHLPLLRKVGRALVPEDRAPLAHVIHQLRLALQ